MKLVFCLLLPVIYGLSSTEFYDYQIKYLQLKWISITDDGGPLNVTIDYDYDSLVWGTQSIWWVNGKVISDGDYNFRVNRIRRHRGMGDTNVAWLGRFAIDEYIKRESILIPPAFQVNSLQLQLVTDTFDVILDITATPPSPRRSIIEYIPKYEMKLNPKDNISYDYGEDVTFRISFTANDLGRLVFDEVKAEFISLEPCTSPPLLVMKTSKRNSDFLSVQTPTRDDDLKFFERVYIDNADHKIRRLFVSYNTSRSSPRGIIKIMTGYRSSSPCRLFAGMKITRTAFLQPHPHDVDVFFPDNAVAFTNMEKNYYVEYGRSLDVSVSAVGGKMIERSRWRWQIDPPEIWLVKKGHNVTSVAEIKRLHEREAIFRFRNVNSTHAGRYLAVAKVGERIVKKDFSIYVHDANPLCLI